MKTEGTMESPNDRGNEQSNGEAAEELTTTTESEPAPPAGEDSPGTAKERELDELRRFRVRTVPPDMRRQWMLAETPVVSTLELQDTVPPNKRPSNAPLNPDPPRPFFTTPRVSTTAATRKLPRVASVPPKAPRVVSREERTLRIVVAAWVVIAVAVLLGYALRDRPLLKETVVPSPLVSEPPTLSALDTSTARQAAETPERAAPTAPQDPAPPPSRADPEAVTNPATKPPQARTDHDRKLPRTSPSASGKIPPAQSPRTNSDIKSPLFGK